MMNDFSFWKEICASSEFAYHASGVHIEDISILLLEAGLAHELFQFSLDATSSNSRYHLETVILKEEGGQYGCLDLGHHLFWFASKDECIQNIIREHELTDTEKTITWKLNLIKTPSLHCKDSQALAQNAHMLEWLTTLKEKENLENTLPFAHLSPGTFRL